MRFQKAWMDPLAGVEDRGNKIQNHGLVPYDMGLDTPQGPISRVSAAARLVFRVSGSCISRVKKAHK